MIGLFGRPNRPFAYPGTEIAAGRSRRGRRPASGPDAVARSVEIGRVRMIVAGVLFALGFSVIGARLVQLMVVDGWIAARAAEAASRVAAQAPATGAPAPATEGISLAAADPDPIAGLLAPHVARADIVDREGRVLATDLPTVNLYADTRHIPDRDRERAIAVLPRLFPDMNPAEVAERMTSRRAFVYLRRNLTPAEQQAVNDLGIPGLEFERSERRVYPAGRLVAHVVGATDIDNIGIAGLEKAFDRRLTTSPEPLALALDLRVQHIVHRALSDAITHFEAVGGAALVMDVATAEVLAMVSLPDYEPEKIGETDEDARFNRATLGVYEMGSTFKLFNTALALDAGLPLTDRFDARQPIRIAGFTINDFHPENKWLSIPEVLMHSSNIGSARMAVAIGGDRQQAFLRRLGLLDPISFELPEVGRPLVPDRWRTISTMTIAFGHGVSVTPLHLTTAVSALVNGGLLRAPTLLKQDGRHPDSRSPAERVLSQENSLRMRALMRLVVESGSGRNADVKGYYVGGKTGSAEKQVGGRYSEKAVRTSFVAAFPMTNPRYVVFAVLDDPKAVKGTHGYRTAGWNATPTVGRIIAEIAPVLGVAPVDSNPLRVFDPDLIQTVGLMLPPAETASPVAPRPATAPQPAPGRPAPARLTPAASLTDDTAAKDDAAARQESLRTQGGLHAPR